MEDQKSKAVGEDVDKQQQSRISRHYQRLTDIQTQQMEELFKECHHPASKQKQVLGTKLGITLERVQFWFQNRRSQIKVQKERADNARLRSENRNLRTENQALKEALQKAVCPACRGSDLSAELAYKEYMHLLCLENSSLNDEVKSVYPLTSEAVGSIEPLEPVKPSPGLQMCSSGKPITTTTSDIMLPSHTSANATIRPCGAVKGLEISYALQSAMIATQELFGMAFIDGSLWSKKGITQVLNLERYAILFPLKHNSNNYYLQREATRDTCVVMMSPLAMVDAFMDVNKWIYMFPSVVTTANTLEVLNPGLPPSHKECLLQLMYAELQVLSPSVSTRKTYFLRYCHRLAEGDWEIVDFSEESIRHNFKGLHFKRPSGCIIQELPDGLSRVTWVEHSEKQDRGVDGMYEQLVKSGMAFGAKRWVTTLERQCQRLVSFMATERGDACGSLVVYSPLDVGAIESAMKGELSSIALLLSGFAIQPDGSPANTSLLGNSSLDQLTENRSNSGLDRGASAGSLLTAAFQVVGSNFPTAKLPLASQKAIANLVCNTMFATLHCGNV